jgi:hypothetical protein
MGPVAGLRQGPRILYDHCTEGVGAETIFKTNFKLIAGLKSRSELPLLRVQAGKDPRRFAPRWQSLAASTRRDRTVLLETPRLADGAAISSKLVLIA